MVNSLQDAENENLPFIIWWTPFTGDENKIKRCWVGDCFFTQNRSFQSHLQTQAFLFYGTDFTDEDIPLPRKGMLYFNPLLPAKFKKIGLSESIFK